jgi:signal transduction histidine kinase
VLTLFLCLMLACGLALGWLGWQALVQDRAAELQRRQERLESAADRVVVAMERAFEAHDVQVTVEAGGRVAITPAGGLAYAPVEAAAAPFRAETFAEAEAWEFTRQELAKAADAYARLAESGSAQVRAEALVRLGRVRRRERKWAEALQAYAELEKSGAVPVGGMPASLVARAARCAVLEESGGRSGLQREAAALWEQLTAGHWKVTKGTLETYLKELKAWAPNVALPAGWQDRVALAAVAQWAYGEPASSGRAGRLADGQVVSVSWQRSGDVWKARLTGPSSWRALWERLEREGGICLRVTDAEGHPVYGNGPAQGRNGMARVPAAVRPAGSTGLPWNVTAALTQASEASDSWSARSRLLIAGLLVFGLLLTSGTFLIARAMSREFAVSRLQSDFVSAVSHEFRTPLTSMRQLSEMLARGRMAGEDQKQRAYELMLGESDRLRRLVESLLDFGRMQAREYRFHAREFDAGEWARSVVEEFQETVRNAGFLVEFDASGGGARIRGDREALGNALWNLLDNAVKYSAASKQARVTLSASNGKVEVSVRDHGIGIARDELKRVFQKFYRGAHARKQGTKGTGIGLTMVKEIVNAHGGTVRVRSEPGRGSEFTMVLPCNAS